VRKLFQSLIWRPLCSDMGRTFLSVLAVALGISVVIAVRLANNAALSAFRQTSQALAGTADLVVHGPTPLPATLLPRLRPLGALAEITPFDDRMALDARTQQVVEVLGLDLVADTSHGDGDATALIAAMPAGPEETRPDIVLTERYSLLHGYRPGDTVTLVIAGRPLRFRIAALLRDQGLARAQEGNVAVLNLADALTVFNPTHPRFDGLQIKLAPGVTPAAFQTSLQPLLPDDDPIEPPSSRDLQSERLLGAFRLNLDAMSYVSLLVGVFLIYNTVSMSVVRRRTAIATARALGAQRAAVVWMFLLEALMLALPGALLGVGLGWVLARGALRFVTLTVNNLYTVAHPGPVRLGPWEWGLAFALGTGSALLAALAPARAAAAVTPAEGLRRGAQETAAAERAPRLLAAGAVCALLSVGLALLPAHGTIPWLGYGSALAAVLASACWVPPLLVTVLPRARLFLLAHRQIAAGLAVASLTAALRRTSVVLVALSTAVAMTFGVAILVGSFRATVQLWVAQTLQADVFIQAADWTRDRPAPLLPALIREIEATPGVAAADEYYAAPYTLRGEPVYLATGWTRDVATGRRGNALSSGSAAIRGRRLARLRFLSGRPAAAVIEGALRHSEALISEPLARHFHLWSGATATLNTADGPAQITIADVYYDYSNDRGTINLPFDVYQHWFGEPPASNLALYAAPGISSDVLRQRVLTRLAAGASGSSGVVVHDNVTLRREIFRIFDQTFRITYALELVALIVAILGVTNTLLAVALERERELGILRFLGSTPRQTRNMLLAEAGVIGVLSLAIGLALGLALAAILIFVINVQSFGWTIQVHLPYGFLLAAGLLILLATVAAGLGPARLANRLDPLRAVAGE